MSEPKGTPLPKLDVARSLRKWEEWGKQPRPAMVEKVYEQSIARAEPAPIEETIKVDKKRSRVVRRK